jgi:formyltetrahydrofolate deformylase
MEKQEIRLLLKAKNRTGISADVSDIIGSIKGDITYESGFEDEEADLYFLRRVFSPTQDYEQTKIMLEQRLEKLSESLENHQIKTSYPSEKNKKVAILVSKETHCLDALLYRYGSENLPMDITSVISNHSSAEKRVRDLGIPFYKVDVTKENKNENKILELINGTDLMVMARYMQILSRDFIESYSGQIINVHHGLLPAFKGASPYKQAFLRGVTKIGATSHFVTADLDDGPIIIQADKDVLTCRTHSDFKMKGISAEQDALVEGVQLFLEDRLVRYNFDYQGKKYEKVAKFF